MQFEPSRAEASRLEWVEEVDSTNAALVARASDTGWPHLSVLATTTQTAGRGRLGRDWVAPPGTSLAVSVLLRPDPPLAPDAPAWVPLAVGLAMVRAVRTLGERHGSAALAAASLKWPNDVLVSHPSRVEPVPSSVERVESRPQQASRGVDELDPGGFRKLCGILCEVLPGGGIVAGVGLNLSLAEHELPVPTATSLTLAGAPGIAVDEALAAFLHELRSVFALLETEGPQAVSPAVAAHCHTLGRAVRVQLPGGARLTGVASGLGADGCLIVETTDGVREVSAGDVTHLRY